MMKLDNWNPGWFMYVDQIANRIFIYWKSLCWYLVFQMKMTSLIFLKNNTSKNVKISKSVQGLIQTQYTSDICLFQCPYFSGVH